MLSFTFSIFYMCLKVLKSRYIEIWVGVRSKVLFGPYPKAFASLCKSPSFTRRVIVQVWGVVVGRKCSFYLLMSSCIAEGLIIKVPSGFSLSPSNSYLADSFYRLLLDRWGVNCLLPNKLLTIFIEVDFLCYNYLFRSSGTPSVD